MTVPLHSRVAIVVVCLILATACRSGDTTLASVPQIAGAGAASVVLSGDVEPGTWILPSDRALFAADADLLADAGAAQGMRSLVAHTAERIDPDEAAVVVTTDSRRLIVVPGSDGPPTVGGVPVVAVYPLGSITVLVVDGLLPDRTS